MIRISEFKNEKYALGIIEPRYYKMLEGCKNPNHFIGRLKLFHKKHNPNYWKILYKIPEFDSYKELKDWCYRDRDYRNNGDKILIKGIALILHGYNWEKIKREELKLDYNNHWDERYTIDGYKIVNGEYKLYQMKNKWDISIFDTNSFDWGIKNFTTDFPEIKYEYYIVSNNGIELYKSNKGVKND